MDSFLMFSTHQDVPSKSLGSKSYNEKNSITVSNSSPIHQLLRTGNKISLLLLFHPLPISLRHPTSRISQHGPLLQWRSHRINSNNNPANYRLSLLLHNDKNGSSSRPPEMIRSMMKWTMIMMP
jgi:hypothetical protein